MNLLLFSWLTSSTRDSDAPPRVCEEGKKLAGRSLGFRVCLGMDSSSRDQLPPSLQYLHETDDEELPKSLRFLASDVKYPNGNYLIHELVLKYPVSCSERDIRAALKSFRGERANDYNEDGYTALQVAVIARSSFMVKMLLSWFPTVDVNAECKRAGRASALHLAAAGDELPFPFVKNKYGRTALDRNKGDGLLEIAKALIERGASLHQRTDDGSTPLHTAAAGNRIEILELFIGKGLDVNATDRFRNTPLHEAARCGSSGAVRVLIKHGARVNKRTSGRSTPLHISAEWNRVDILALLIGKGANVNAKDHWGRTPLREAAEGACLRVLRVLVEGGADRGEGDNDGRTPLHIAAERNRVDVLQLLIDRDAEINKSLRRSRRLRHKIVDVNAKDRWGCTPLHRAVQNSYLEAVRVLVENGAALEECDNHGSTALRIAETRNNVEIVEYLNSRVSNVNAAVERDDLNECVETQKN